MILLDTNVLSEFMRPKPNDAVVAWLDALAPEKRYGFAPLASPKSGLGLMPTGTRQAALAQAAEAMFSEDFAGRCLPFDAQAACQMALTWVRDNLGHASLQTTSRYLHQEADARFREIER
ncbi:hypothetical protein JCM13664_21890 [Methylothermus subterraneus]